MERPRDGLARYDFFFPSFSFSFSFFFFPLFFFFFSLGPPPTTPFPVPQHLLSNPLPPSHTPPLSPFAVSTLFQSARSTPSPAFQANPVMMTEGRKKKKSHLQHVMYKRRCEHVQREPVLLLTCGAGEAFRSPHPPGGGGAPVLSRLTRMTSLWMRFTKASRPSWRG